MEKLADMTNVGPAERIVSGSAGAVLIAMGIREIKHPSVKTLAEIITGGFLLFRGVTAFCPLRAALKKNTEE
ncbi:MAG TPA: DUF2892 domain-containing protein [Chitinophagaceae bacterium]